MNSTHQATARVGLESSAGLVERRRRPLYAPACRTYPYGMFDDGVEDVVDRLG